jgi:hypothetical protein
MKTHGSTEKPVPGGRNAGTHSRGHKWKELGLGRGFSPQRLIQIVGLMVACRVVSSSHHTKLFFTYILQRDLGVVKRHETMTKNRDEIITVSRTLSWNQA